MWNTQGLYDFPTACLPLHIFVMHLFLLTPAYLCLSFHITTLLSFHQCVMIQEPRTESEQEEHTVTSQAQSGGPLLLHAEVVTGTSSLTIVPLPETARQSGSPTSVALSEYPCWLKQSVGFCEYSLAVSCQFCLQACKPCSLLKSVTWLCMTVISGWNRNLSVSICFEGAKYN